MAAAAFTLSSGAIAGPKDAQARKMLKQALEEDYLETRFDDAEQKLRAAIQLCATSGCADGVRAELHCALGAVLAGGKKELEDARDEFVEALKADPKAKPDPGMLSTEVTFAFEQAKARLGMGSDSKPKPPPPPPPDAPPKKPKPSPEPLRDGDDKPKDVDDKTKDGDDKTKDEKPARKNWFTLGFAPDLSIVGGTNVCSDEVRKSSHYVCVRNDPNNTTYVGTPTKDNGNNINPGVALSTLRLMLAYDRLIIDNLTLGARLGFAFNGGSGEAKFIPVHAEGRIGYWPGKKPFVGSIVRPYLMLSAGMAQIDTKVNVEVLEDGKACGAPNPGNTTSPCTVKSRDGTLEKRVQTLTVYKQAGLGFGALSFGVHFVPSPAVALYLAVRGNITFPVVSGVISPEGGLALGF